MPAAAFAAAFSTPACESGLFPQYFLLIVLLSVFDESIFPIDVLSLSDTLSV
jgi:hypothetical protein